MTRVRFGVKGIMVWDTFSVWCLCQVKLTPNALALWVLGVLGTLGMLNAQHTKTFLVILA